MYHLRTKNEPDNHDHAVIGKSVLRDTVLTHGGPPPLAVSRFDNQVMKEAMGLEGMENENLVAD